MFEIWLHPLLHSEWIVYADSPHTRSIPICIYTCMEDQFSPQIVENWMQTALRETGKIETGQLGGGVGGRCGRVANSYQLKFALCINVCDAHWSKQVDGIQCCSLVKVKLTDGRTFHILDASHLQKGIVCAKYIASENLFAPPPPTNFTMLWVQRRLFW